MRGGDAPLQGCNIPSMVVGNSTLSLALVGVVPAVCDAEAGEADEVVTDRADSPAAPPVSGPAMSLFQDNEDHAHD